MVRFSCGSLPVVLALSSAVWAGSPQVNFNESFGDDPVANGRASVVGNAGQVGYNPTATTLNVDSELPRVAMVWDLSQPITDAWSFTMSATFSIAPGYVADPNGFSQLVSFGLLNSVTTGGNRSGGPDDGDFNIPDPPADTFDLVSVDYFANVSPFFSSLTLTPTVFGSNDGSDNGFNVFSGPFGTESLIDDTANGEPGPLTAATAYTAQLDFDAITRALTLRLFADQTPVLINAGGGSDADVMTIQHTLPSGIGFVVDQIGVMSWKDFYDDAGWTTVGEPSAEGDVSYTALSLTAEQTVPEPTALVLMGVGVGGLVLRRKRA